MENIFKPSIKNILLTIALVPLTFLSIVLMLGYIVDCMMSWGCSGVRMSLLSGLGYLLGIVLVLPVYAIWYFINVIINSIFVSTDWLDNTKVTLSILGVSEIIYLYILSCLILFGWHNYRK